MNTILRSRRPRLVVATGVSAVVLLMVLSMAPSGLVRTARADADGGPTANTQVAELHELQASVHGVISYNGDPIVAAQHLEEFGELYADDATLTITDTNQVFQGRDAILAFWAANPLFNSNLVSLSPAFKTTIAVDGDTALLYFECHIVNPATDAVVRHRKVNALAKHINGRWVIQTQEIGPTSL